MTIESEEFYNLMQSYRWSPIENPKNVCDAYEAIKEHIANKIKEVRKAEKERAAKLCDRFAEYGRDGAGFIEHWGERFEQVADKIRSLPEEE